MPKARRRLPGGLTGNALVAGIVTGIVGGAISFYVARWQSQDSARQAIASQRIQEVIQLETDAKTFFLVAYGAYINRQECLGGTASSCNQADSSISSSPLISAENALGADLANVSDTAAKKDADSLTYYALQALSEDGTSQGFTAWESMNNAYDNLLARCGLLIQGRV
jgi:hypothetical protein